MKKNVSIKVWYFFFAILFFIINCSKVVESPVVAEVNGLKITLDEFKDFYQFNHRIMQIKNPVIAKRQILAALIAEKMIALKGYQDGIDKEDNLSNIIHQFEREAIIEKFWQDSIFNQISISEEKLKEAYFRSKQEKIVLYLIYNNKEAAANDYLRLQKSMQFEELAKLKGYSVETIPVDTIRFSAKIPSIEKRVFSMKYGEISKPVKEGRYYFIFKIIGERRNIFTAEDDFIRQKKKLRKILKTSEIRETFNNYIKRNFTEKPYHLDRAAFKELAQFLDGRIFVNNLSMKKNGNAAINNEVGNLKEDLASRPVVKFPDGEIWTNKRLLKRLAVSPYPLIIKSPASFRKSIISAVKHILDDEVIVKHAKKSVIEDTYYVRQQLQMWRDYIVYQKTMNEEIKTYSKNKTDKYTLSEIYSAYLKRIKKEFDITLYTHIIDTLRMGRSDMVVIKKHFPLRTIIPDLHPLTNMPDLPALIFSND